MVDLDYQLQSLDDAIVVQKLNAKEAKMFKKAFRFLLVGTIYTVIVRWGTLMLAYSPVNGVWYGILALLGLGTVWWLISNWRRQDQTHIQWGMLVGTALGLFLGFAA